MSAHLSALSLEEAVASLPLSPEAQAHLAGCTDCSMKVGVLRAENDKLLAAPRATATLNKLVAAHGAKPKSPMRWIVPIFSAVAASVLVLAVVPRLLGPDENRLKGNTVGVYVVQEDQHVDVASVGDKVSVVVSTGTRLHVALFAVDGAGEVSRLWPTEGTRTGALDKAGIATLARDFEVTAGSVELFAAFSDEPTDLQVLEAELRSWLATGSVPTNPSRAWAQNRLEVR